jgi:hypothetical protein
MAAKVVVSQGPVVADTTQATQIVRGTITLSGNYGGGATNGDTLSFAAMPNNPTNAVPLRVFIYEQPAAGTAPGGWRAIFCPGTTIANGVVAFFNGTSQLTQGNAYSGTAAVANAVWAFEAIFPVGF